MTSGTSIAPTSVLSSTQATLVDEIKTYHRGVRKSYEHQIQYALLAGIKLTALKETLKETGHPKQFMAFRETHLPEISRSAAGRYMDFYSLLKSELPTVGNMKSSNLLLENGDLPDEQKAQVLRAAYKQADGKTWTQFYRDLDLVRQSKAKEYHAPKPVSPDDAEAAAKLHADEMAKTLLTDIELIKQNDTWSLLTSARQAEIEDARLTLGAFIKKNSPRKK